MSVTVELPTSERGILTNSLYSLSLLCVSARVVMVSVIVVLRERNAVLRAPDDKHAGLKNTRHLYLEAVTVIDFNTLKSSPCGWPIARHQTVSLLPQTLASCWTRSFTISFGMPSELGSDPRGL